MTHGQLVERAARWLKNTKRCGVVVTEFVSNAPEVPDAFGLAVGGMFSYLIECKTSVSDFYADRRKSFRRAGTGVGQHRYYMTPPGLLKMSQLPEHWGLLEYDGIKSNRVLVVREANFVEIAARCEVRLLYSMLRRGMTFDIEMVTTQPQGTPS